MKNKRVYFMTTPWPTYRGKHVGTDDVRAWIEQAPDPRDQRILFELLRRVKFFSEALIRERLKAGHSLLRPDFPVNIIRSRGQRRSDIIITYVDGPGKSGAAYAALYAEENAIDSGCVLAPGDFREHYERYIQKSTAQTALLIVDDIAATGNTLSEKMASFLVSNRDLLENIAVRVLTLVSTKSGQRRILESFKAFPDINVDFRSCEVLDESSEAIPANFKVWNSEADAERARALCIQLGSRINKQRPFGYGGMGLLVVFPTTVPNNCLPILHSEGRLGSSGHWRPLFLRPNN